MMTKHAFYRKNTLFTKMFLIKLFFKSLKVLSKTLLFNKKFKKFKTVFYKTFKKIEFNK
jgi:hypothetical protein